MYVGRRYNVSLLFVLRHSCETTEQDSLQTLLDLVGEWTAPERDANAPVQPKPEPTPELNPLAAALNQVQWGM
jgi:hypothetical protein